MEHLIEEIRKVLEADSRAEALIVTHGEESEMILLSARADDFKDLQWFPDHEQITFHYPLSRYTSRILFQDASRLTFTAVIRQELFLLRMLDFEILFNRADITTELNEIRQMTELRGQSTRRTPAAHWGEFLFHLSEGLELLNEGAELAAQHKIKCEAMKDLLGVIDDTALSLADFEKKRPDISQELAKVLNKHARECAGALLSIAEKSGSINEELRVWSQPLHALTESR